MAQKVNLHVEGIIEDIKPFLPKLIQACETVVEILYRPMSAGSWEQLGDVVEGMDDLYRTLSSVHSEMVNGDRYYVLEPSIARFIESLKHNFQAMNACIDEENYAGASDFLKYELIPLFQQLQIEFGEEKKDLEYRFSVNMSYFQKKYPKLYEQLNKISRDQYKYQLFYSKNGLPNLCVINDGKPEFLYSLYNPVHACQRWVERIAEKVEDKTYIIQYGFGFGYHALRYVEEYPEHKLCIFEPDEQILLAAMCVFDMRDIFDRLPIVDFVVGIDKVERDRMFFRFLKFMKGEPQIIALPIYDRLRNFDQRGFSKDAQIAILNYASSVSIYEKQGLQWLTNSMYNLAATLTTPSIQGLKNRLNGMTAVIAGAGPSLEADIELLKRLKDHAFIIAAGTTIQSLLHFGIRPHLIVSMDGTEGNYNAFKGLDLKGIPLLFTPMVQYKIIDDKKDQLFHVHFINDLASKYFLKLRNTDTVFHSNHSVTGTAIHAAAFLGCKEIIFTGQDLSYPNENMYSPGARHLAKDKNDTIIKTADLTVENVIGTTNRTNQAMNLTLEDIGEVAGRYSEIRFINTTKMGAKIKNTTWMPMEDVLKRLQGKRIEADFFIKEMENLQLYEQNRIDRTRNEIITYPEQIKTFEERLKRIDQHINKLAELSRVNPKKCFTTFNNIDSEWKKIVDSGPFNSFYCMVLRNDVNAFERDLPELTNQSNLIKKSELAQSIMQPFIRKMLERIPELMEIAIETKRRVEARL